MMRRTLALAVIGAVAGAALAAPPVQASPRHHDAARGYDQPSSGWMPADTRLRDGRPQQVGLDPATLTSMLATVDSYRRPQAATGKPLYPGAVTLVARDGRVVTRDAKGFELLYADEEGTELPVSERERMHTDSIFDIASITKLFTSTALMQQVEKGRIDLDEPVATYLPAFAQNGKGTITPRELLTHVSGLPASMPLDTDWPDIPSRLAAVMAVEPEAAPGVQYVYSDINMIVAGLLVEHATGKGLDRAVADGITGPLRMRDTSYNPPASKLHRIAATEWDLTHGRGIIRGSVHDEKAWALAGVAGHAGVFSTADDLAVLGQAFLNGGAYGGKRILKKSTVDAMFTNFNQKFPDDSHGLGFELDQIWYMGGLGSARTAGHTGFTGTSMVIDPASRSIAILMTNRVHPSRDNGTINPARRAVVDGVADAMKVTPRAGRDAWRTGAVDATTSTLTLPAVTVRRPGTRLTFDYLVDSEPVDLTTLQASRDGGTTWTAVPFTGAPTGSVSGQSQRRWKQATASLGAPGKVTLRWTHTTDTNYHGRGVYVDDVQVRAGRTKVLDGERCGCVVGEGWAPSRR
ncbi:MAG: serine hydrolase [Nocardioidaceae bacterium]|nr:serine hydrolase [Nocardioidaceae bacterium]